MQNPCPEKKYFECAKCQKTFDKAGNLNRHLKIHGGTDEKPFKCNQCEKRFHQKSNLE